METTITYRDEFPDFDYQLPIIEGFDDSSWHNDVCPSLTASWNPELILWCDYADESLRELEGGKRFTLILGEYGEIDDQMTLMQTDDILEIRRALAQLEETK